MSQELPPKTKEVIDHINLILRSHNCSIQGDENEFFRYISWHTAQAQNSFAIFKKNVASFRIAEHRDTIRKISTYGKYIISNLDQMSYFESSLLKFQLDNIKPVEGFDSQESLTQFQGDILQFTQAMDVIIDQMGELSPGSPVRKHLAKLIQFEFLQLIASVCIQMVDKQPSSDPYGYFCELAGYLLEQATGEEESDSYRIVKDIFTMTHLPDPKYG